MAKKKDDWITLVNPPKDSLRSPIFDIVARGLAAPRVIHLVSEIDPRGYNDVLAKVRGKDLIQLIFTVPTVRLRHKNREWMETEQFYLRIPIKLAAKLGEKMVRLSKKYLRKKR